MRRLLILLTALAACGGDDDGSSQADAAPHPDATLGDAAVADAGTADASPFARVATVQSGGDQHVLVGKVLASDIVYKVTDLDGNPVNNLDVAITASPGVAVHPRTGQTDGNGTFTVSVQAGLHVGVNTVTLAAADTGGGVAAFTIDEVTQGQIISVVDPLRLFGISAPLGPTPAITSELRTPVHAVADALGGFFVDDAGFCSIFRVDADGVLTRVAGTGTCGAGDGDGGPASMATLNGPADLAYDAALNVLFVAEAGDNRVRIIDLASGNIAPYFGDGTGADGTAALEGRSAGTVGFPAPSRLAASGGELFVSNADGRTVRVDFSGTVHDVFFIDPAGDTGCGAVDLRLITAADGAMARAADGSLFVLATACGTLASGTTAHRAIIKRAPDGALTWVAGNGGNGVEGPLGQVGFSSDAPALQMSGADHLLVSDTSGPLAVRRVTIASGATDLLIGPGPSDPADYVSAMASGLASGGGATQLTTGDIVIPEGDLFGVREIR